MKDFREASSSNNFPLAVKGRVLHPAHTLSFSRQWLYKLKANIIQNIVCKSRKIWQFQLVFE